MKTFKVNKILTLTLMAIIVMSCTYVPIHVPRGVDELENGDRVTVKTTDGETFVLWVKKADREHIIGYKDLELDLHVLSVAKIKEMYPVQVKDRLKIYAENGEVTKMKVLTLEKNNILGIGRTRHLGTKKYSPKQNYQIPFSDIEKIESLTFTTHHSGFMIHL